MEALATLFPIWAIATTILFPIIAPLMIVESFIQLKTCYKHERSEIIWNIVTLSFWWLVYVVYTIAFFVYIQDNPLP